MSDFILWLFMVVVIWALNPAPWPRVSRSHWHTRTYPDFIRQGRLDVSTVKMVVLDEADEMLKMGFKDDLDAILEGTPNKQTLLFSATMPKGIEAMPKNMSEARQIAVWSQSGQSFCGASIFLNSPTRSFVPFVVMDALQEWKGLSLPDAC